MTVPVPARTATIIVPMLPPVECSPNWYGSWRRKAKAVRQFREAAGWATLPIRLGGAEWGHPVVMDFEVAWCCRRKRMDDGNCKAAMKALVDGIADVLWNGDDSRVEIGRLVQKRGSGTVTVRLTEAE